MADLKFVADFTDIQTMRRELVGVAKDAKQSAGVFEREYRKVERQLQQSAKANQQFYNNALQVDRVNKNAAKSAEVFTKELQRQEQATANYNKETERLKLQYNSTYRAAQLFKTQLRELGEAHSRGAISADRHEQQVRELKNEYRAFLKNGGGPMNQFGQVASKNTRIMKRFGAVGVQQLGYQIQDFAVQVQSGTSVLVALGQQGSQLLGIFGPAGAIAGMILAIGTGLAGAFLAARDAANDAADGTSAFADALENAKSRSESLAAELKVLKGGYEDVTEAALDSAVKQAEAALQAARAQTVQEMGAFGAMGGGQETIDRRVAAAEKELKLAQEKLDNYQKLIAEEERLSQKSEEANQERMLGEQMLQKEREDALAQFQADLAATAKTLDAVFKSRTLYYRIQFAGEAQVMGQEVKPAGSKLKPGFSYEELLGMGYTPDDLARIGMDVPSKFKPKMRPMDLGAGSGSSGGGSGGGGGKSTTDVARENLQKLEEQLELEEALIGKSDERKRVIKALGIEFAQQNPQIVAGLEDQITKIDEMTQRENQIKKLGDTIKSSLGDAFMSIVDGSKSAGDAFKDMARLVLKQAFDMLVIQPILNGIFGSFGGGGGGFLSALFSANGNAFTQGGKLTAYANGGVVTAPTAFQHSGGLGVMGEAGPEAIMPLKRGKNGKLGVQTEGSQGNVTVENHFHIAANGDDSVKRIIAQEAPRIANLTQKQILDQRRRGGAMKSTFG